MKHDSAIGAEFDTAMQECLIRLMQKSDDSITLGKMKAACEKEMAATNAATEPKDGVAEVKETALEERGQCRKQPLDHHAPPAELYSVGKP